MCELTEQLRRGFGGLVPPVCDEAANEIDRLRAKDVKVSEAIREAFGKTPVASDGILLVTVDKYNALVDALNT